MREQVKRGVGEAVVAIVDEVADKGRSGCVLHDLDIWGDAVEAGCLYECLALLVGEGLGGVENKLLVLAVGKVELAMHTKGGNS